MFVLDPRGVSLTHELVFFDMCSGLDGRVVPGALKGTVLVVVVVVVPWEGSRDSSPSLSSSRLLGGAQATRDPFVVLKGVVFVVVVVVAWGRSREQSLVVVVVVVPSEGSRKSSPLSSSS